MLEQVLVNNNWQRCTLLAKQNWTNPGLDAGHCCCRDLLMRHAHVAAGCLAHPILPEILNGLQQGVGICLCVDHHVQVSCCQLQQPLHDKQNCCLWQSQVHKRGPRRLPIKSLLQAVLQETHAAHLLEAVLTKPLHWQAGVMLEMWLPWA